MRRWFQTLTAIALICISGCAVLEVKVDVYKGPLASHDDVIAQRVAASTIGMQSDLLRLQQALLETRNGKPEEVDFGATCRPDNRVDDPNEAFACEIERLLDLFEPPASGEPEIMDFRTAVESLTDIRDSALSRLDRDGANQAQRSAEEQIARELWTLASRNPDTNKARLAVAYACFLDDESGEQSVCQYDGFAASGFRIWETIFGCAAQIEELKEIGANTNSGWIVLDEAATLSFQSTPIVIQDAELAGGQRREGEPDYQENNMGCLSYRNLSYDRLDREIGSNVGFDALTDQRILQSHADYLFDEEAKGRSFIDTVTSIAFAFEEVRDAQEQYLVEGSKFLRWLSDLDRTSSAAQNRIGEIVVESLSLLVDPSQLLNAFCLADAEYSELAEYSAFRSAILDQANPCWTREVYADDVEVARIETFYEEFRGRLEHQLRARSGTASRMLLGLHELYRFAPRASAQPSGIPEEDWSAEKRKYGITVGPPQLRREQPFLASSQRQRGSGDNTRRAVIPWGPAQRTKFDVELRKLNQQLRGASPFDRGRLPDGLWQFVETFVEASDEVAKARGDCEAGSRCEEANMQFGISRERLAAAIVRFAEKTVGLANSAHEFSTYGNTSLARKGQTPAQYELYAIVLQRIGNSALAIVDDMYARAEYDADQDRRSEVEAAAITQAFGGDATATYLRLRQSVEAAIKREVAAVSSAADELATLRAALVAATARQKTAQDNCASRAAKLVDAVNIIDRPSAKPNLVLCSADSAALSPANAYQLQRPSDLWKPQYEATQKQLDGSSDNSIRSAALAPTVAAGSTSAADYFTAIISAIDAAGPGAAADTTAHNQIKSIVQSVLKDTAFQAGARARLTNIVLPSGTTESAKYVLETTILAELKARIEAYETHASIVASIGQLRSALTTATTAVTTAQAGVTAKESGPSNQNAKPDLARSALAALDAAQSQVLATLQGGLSESISPADVREQAARAIENRGSEFKEIAAYVRTLPAPQAMPSEIASLIEARGDATSKEVLDGLITALRFEQIRVIREQGEDSAAAKYAEEALEAAYRQRSDQIYLRPAISYLRTSFASSALGNNAIRWRNQLTDLSYRAVPAIGGRIENQRLFLGDRNSTKNLYIREANDTQFWQNVNNVRVSGTGGTNYVVTKDDIGNWYVRGYETDQDDIVKSMSRLATFNVGARASSGLANIGDLESDENTPESSNPLERLYDDRLETFDQRTDAAYQALRSKLEVQGESNRIASSVILAWAAHDVLGKIPDAEPAVDGGGGNSTAAPSAPVSTLKPVALQQLEILHTAAANMASAVSAVEQKRDQLETAEERAKYDDELRRVKISALQIGYRAYNGYYSAVAGQVSTLATLASSKDGMKGQQELAVEVLGVTIGALLREEIEKRQTEIDDHQGVTTILSQSVSAN